jgi:hypothetical protein
MPCLDNRTMEQAMSEDRVKVRANRASGELEIEGPASVVEAWWTRLWPELNAGEISAAAKGPKARSAASSTSAGDLPEIFGEFFSEFRTDITEGDKVLVAGAFVQRRDAERIFTTKSVNQLLVDQNIKVANASVSVRRLIEAKRAFVVSDGKFRISTSGFDHLKSLGANV